MRFGDDAAGLDGFGPNEYAAQEVLRKLSVFPERFHELGANGELRNLLNSPEKLSGPEVHQKPEFFTEQYLIEPILYGLGFDDPTSDTYNEDAPYFIRRPSTFDTVEQKRPDYLLKLVDSEVVCFLEAKAANRERPDGGETAATDQVNGYLRTNAFHQVDYFDSPDRRYLVGIATDGFRWSLHSKDLETGERRSNESMIDLTDLVDWTPWLGGRDTRTKNVRTKSRARLASEFTPVFGAHSLGDYTKRRFE